MGRKIYVKQNKKPSKKTYKLYKYNNKFPINISYKTAKQIEAIEFYRSFDWLRVRYEVLRKYGYSCMCCGRSVIKHKITIHVDHIIPRSRRPELSLKFDNLQVLCEDCNLGKSNRCEDDFRNIK